SGSRGGRRGVTRGGPSAEGSEAGLDASPRRLDREAVPRDDDLPQSGELRVRDSAGSRRSTGDGCSRGEGSSASTTSPERRNGPAVPNDCPVLTSQQARITVSNSASSSEPLGVGDSRIEIVRRFVAFERYKTTHDFDSTVAHPEWLG